MKSLCIPYQKKEKKKKKKKKEVNIEIMIRVVKWRVGVAI